MNKILLSAITLTVFSVDTYAGDIYVKKNIGHNFTTTNPHFNVGLGYQYNDEIRNDITFGYASLSKTGHKERKFSVMANSYYDFDNASEYMPYIMAGAGVNRTIVGNKDGVKYRTNFVYQFGGGLSYKLKENIFLDTEYKVLGETKKYEKGFPIMHQVVNSGIRVHF